MSISLTALPRRLKRTNEIQELSESAPLGIPVIFSMDTEAGAAFVKDATFLPDEINQGAVGDPRTGGAASTRCCSTELMAVGVRMALSPDADLITDPRWGRNQECYSEDTDVVQALIVAAVQALQGGSSLTEDSVIATVKHFPGSGGTDRRRGRHPPDHSGGLHRPAPGGLPGGHRGGRGGRHALRVLHRPLPGRRRGGEFRRSVRGR